MSAPRAVTVSRGESVPLEIDIDREKLGGAVTVSIAGLPQGLAADETTKRVETTGTTFILRASNDAALVKNHAVDVTAAGPDGIKATQTFLLTVRE